ncbi:putative dienelactone hydrolase family protein [Phaeoacremonium minimum UCRPA7]|uniref:Putative dienelactone hydrolase family protein n=1 Tax=Phaeoacremonium minimum (strain UCR-PA7) TaxID=1286976 RepID=R8BWN7_PHAM7|nr:putative dienelactone hydrolase family protein [Phaeoacremonium minimum UCRPA7]EOO03714.1 putative dienelactone hydrolase family protein [Phaeoacremonium minimum UCRPA7]
MQSVQLCAEPAIEGGSEPLVDAHFAAHPSGLKATDLVRYSRRFVVPFSLALGDEDFIFSKDVAANLEVGLREIYSEEPSHFEARMYTGCGHGFAVRADREKTNEDKAANEAASQAAEWFQKFLA